MSTICFVVRERDSATGTWFILDLCGADGVLDAGLWDSLTPMQQDVLSSSYATRKAAKQAAWRNGLREKPERGKP